MATNPLLLEELEVKIKKLKKAIESERIPEASKAKMREALKNLQSQKKNQEENQEASKEEVKEETQPKPKPKAKADSKPKTKSEDEEGFEYQCAERARKLRAKRENEKRLKLVKEAKKHSSTQEFEKLGVKAESWDEVSASEAKEIISKKAPSEVREKFKALTWREKLAAKVQTLLSGAVQRKIGKLGKKKKLSPDHNNAVGKYRAELEARAAKEVSNFVEKLADEVDAKVDAQIEVLQSQEKKKEKKTKKSNNS